MSHTQIPSNSLTDGVMTIINLAQAIAQSFHQTQIVLPHLLLAVFDRHEKMVSDLAVSIDIPGMRKKLESDLESGKPFEPIDLLEIIHLALRLAESEGKSKVSERHFITIILFKANIPLNPLKKKAIPDSTSDATKNSAQQSSTSTYRAVEVNINTLKQFGRDLTEEALQNKLSPVVGRDREIEIIIETLCRQTKRNPCLIGPAGIGKTAIVEGLAQRVVNGDVPDILKNHRIIAIQPSNLVAGASMAGELENRIKKILQESSQPGIILFIDEIHSIVGAGGLRGSSDIASLIKPALARGEIACIAATTDDEYRRYIEPDAALERRFQPIRIHPLTPEQTLEILRARYQNLSENRKVQIEESLLNVMVNITDRYIHNRYFPDKAVDLFEQCIAYAITKGKKTLTREDVEHIAHRVIGIPVDLKPRLLQLSAQLNESALLNQTQINQLMNRLEVTTQGMDLYPNRPNAILLFLNNATHIADALSRMIANTLFGSLERIVYLDLSQMVHAEHISMLLGSPPGYVGFGEARPIHKIIQMPWCVVYFDNFHLCHPSIREVIAQALKIGFFTDAQNKRIYLSDAIVFLTAEIGWKKSTGIGFHPVKEEENILDELGTIIDRDLLRQIDLIFYESIEDHSQIDKWVEKNILKIINKRYQKEGLGLIWDKSFIDWLVKEKEVLENWENWFDKEIAPLLLPHLIQTKKKNIQIVIYRENDTLKIKPQQKGE